MAIDKFPYIFKKFVKSPIALITRNQISTWPMWKSDFQEIVAHSTENWSCGFLHGPCGDSEKCVNIVFFTYNM